MSAGRALAAPAGRRRRFAAVACALALAAAVSAPRPPALAAGSVAGAVQKALRERDDRQRARQLEDALRGADGADAAEAVLEKLLPKARNAVDEEIGVVALARMRTPEALAVVAAAARSAGDFAVRAGAVEALGRGGSPDDLDVLAPLTRDADPRVRAAAATSLGERGVLRSSADVRALLADADWRVRSAAVWALAREGWGPPERAPEADAVDGPLELVEMLRREDGRLLDDLAAALQHITGEGHGPYPGPYLRLWAEHWKLDRPAEDREFRAPPPTIDTPLLASRSRRVLVVLATGESMKDEVLPPALSPGAAARLRALGPDLVEAHAEARTKLALCKVYAQAILRSLADGTRFDVAVYADSPTFAFGEYVEANDRTRKRAESRIASLSPGGGGNLEGTLRRAFDPRGRGVYESDDGPDTIVLFSDGRLAAPGTTDRNQVVLAVRRWNRVRQVRFVVVAPRPNDDSVLGPFVSEPPLGAYVELP